MVTICMPRSKECVCMVLALLKIKIPFLLLPIDTPKKRKRYMIYDSCSEYVIEYVNSQYAFTPVENLNKFLYNDTALVMYTSGSSGNPKGAVISRKTYQYFLEVANEALKYEEKVNIHLASAPFSFDSYLLELLLPLFIGKTVVLSNDNESKNPRLLGKLILRHAVDSILITPTKITWLIESNRKYDLFSNINTLILGGEHVRKPLIDKLRTVYKQRLINIYGPAETTVFVTYKYITNSNDISIGQKLPGGEVLILNDKLEEMPEGEIGEICISGPSLADGYINNDELTKSSFTESLGKVIYKTGDLGKFLNNELQILGRKDRQIKINGCRIELDELENLILSINNIANCAVCYRKSSNEIYVYYESMVTIKKEEWNIEMKEYISEYVMPNDFIRVDKIKQNNSGKVDHFFYDKITNYDRENVTIQELLNENEVTSTYNMSSYKI